VSLAELEAKVKDLELQVRNLQDVRDIERLQRAYGFYLERWAAKEIVDLFSDSPGVSLIITTGQYKGKEKIRQYYEYMLPRITPEFSHHLMQLGGVISVDASGKTAQGRWFGFGLTGVPVGDTPVHGLLSGIYEIDYVKERGVWKFMKINWRIIKHISPKNGWERTQTGGKFLAPDVPAIPYPVEYRFPFHFKNPVTGK
jgi:hypothetical protein